MIATYLKRIKKLTELFDLYGIDGYVVPSHDEFRNEYTPSHLKRLEWISGFTGSNGVALVTKKELFFFTDSRYVAQAKNELADFQIFDFAKLPKAKTLASCMLGYDPMIESEFDLGKYQKIAPFKELNMVAVKENLIDLIWDDKPYKKQSSILHLSIKDAGMSTEAKIGKILKKIDSNVDYLLINKPDAICWLLNIRGGDVEYSPLVLAYLAISRNGQCYLFSDSFSDSLEITSDRVIVRSLNFVQQFFIDQIISGMVFQSSKSISIWFKDIARNQLIIREDLVENAKSIKSQVEIENIKKAHFFDGVALCKFICWLCDSWGKITEIDAAEKILELRKRATEFVEPSFATISAFGANGAIIHYKATKKTNKKIIGNNLYLIDSGGQYKFGTTDVTRTFCFGDPTLEQKTQYTLVLKGMIRLSNLKFPLGTTGAQLDSLARFDLWQYGLDYGHGTGHGVGYFLGVHEGPQAISRYSAIPLAEGMVISNEPGYYKDDAYGIRIENMLLVKKSDHDGFLEFETLTLAPITKELINLDMLDDIEVTWLTQYNLHVAQKMLGHLDEDEKNKLQRLCNY